LNDVGWTGTESINDVLTAKFWQLLNDVGWTGTESISDVLTVKFNSC